MGIYTMLEKFPDQESCLKFLEKIRFRKNVYCPHCGSVRASRKNKNQEISRWNCLDCHSSFSVISGTLFSKSQIPLRKWFLAISMVINARKGISSPQLARELELDQKTAWYLLTRIRRAVKSKEVKLLEGIVEADETYIGGKPRRHGRPKVKRGRGTNKTPVLGIVERGGKVVAKIVESVNGGVIRKFVADSVNLENSTLMTDEFGGYNSLPRKVVKHKETFGDGEIYTNTIESFWALIKRAWHGVHHWYTKKYLPLYVVEACWKYNHRHSDDMFMDFMVEIF